MPTDHVKQSAQLVETPEGGKKGVQLEYPQGRRKQMGYQGTWTVDEITGRQIVYIGEAPCPVAITAYGVCNVQYNFANTDQTNMLGHKLLEGQSMVVVAKVVAVASYNAEPAKGTFCLLDDPVAERKPPPPKPSEPPPDRPKPS